MDGYLLIDKPVGWTSHDVVAKIRGLIKQQLGIKKPKVGHAGTLDPFATGLLIILVGKYTKRANEFLKLNKSYEFRAKLGEISTTGDLEGEIKTFSNNTPTLTEMRDVLSSFLGEVEQIPPTFSAIKVNGQRAYKLARKGNKVEMPKRLINIYELKLIKYEYPYLSCICSVSSGTYIRTLAEDIGKSLKTGAYLTNLKRISIGEFSLKMAHKIEENNLLDNLLV